MTVFGSTGSVGTQALDIVRANPDRFRVVGLTAGGSNPELFERQVAEFRPVFAGLGEEASTEAAGRPCDVVLNAITGAVGLRPTLAALDAGNTLALANKESLIIGGPLVVERAKPGTDRARRLRAQRSGAVPARRLARRGTPAGADGERGAVSCAGRSRSCTTSPSSRRSPHPTWDMGPVVTINSATLVNKGLEVIEAHLLFGDTRSTGSTSSCTRPAWCTRWSSSWTVRPSSRPARRPC